MKEDEIEFGRFKKTIKNIAFSELQSVFQILDTLQTHRNCSEICLLLSNIPAEKPEIWLSDFLCNPSTQRLLNDRLKDNEKYKDFISSLKRIQAHQKLLRKRCSLPIALRTKAIFVVGHEIQIRKLIDILRKSGIQNIAPFEKKIRSTIGCPLEFEDMFFEGKFAYSVTKQLNSIENIKFYPTGKTKGPDYKFDYKGNQIFIEFTRFRVDEELRKNLMISQSNTKLINIPYGYEEIWNKIKGKLIQLIPNEINLVVLYSSHDARGQHDFRHVTNNYLDNKINEGLLKNLSGVLFAEGWSTPPELWINNKVGKKFPEELKDLFKKAINDMKISPL